MHFGRCSYLVTIFLCAGVPLFLEYVLVNGVVRYYRRLIAVVTLVMLVATWIWDGTGLAWGAWKYVPERALGIWLGGLPIETYLAALLVTPAVAIATLAWANFPLDLAAAATRLGDAPAAGPIPPVVSDSAARSRS
jgi:lycopene cyclase domain-containing protein